jgi:hypothetical protein
MCYCRILPRYKDLTVSSYVKASLVAFLCGLKKDSPTQFFDWSNTYLFRSWFVSVRTSFNVK